MNLQWPSPALPRLLPVQCSPGGAAQQRGRGMSPAERYPPVAPPQIVMYEAELERAHGQMLEEMQAMEEEKNHAIEEAFSRAQVEMKAVHENLAGEEGTRGSWSVLAWTVPASGAACPSPPPGACRGPDQPADAAAGAAHPHPRLQQPEASGS